MNRISILNKVASDRASQYYIALLSQKESHYNSLLPEKPLFKVHASELQPLDHQLGRPQCIHPNSKVLSSTIDTPFAIYIMHYSFKQSAPRSSTAAPFFPRRQVPHVC